MVSTCKVTLQAWLALTSSLFCQRSLLETLEIHSMLATVDKSKTRPSLSTVLSVYLTKSLNSAKLLSLPTTHVVMMEATLSSRHPIAVFSMQLMVKRTQIRSITCLNTNAKVEWTANSIFPFSSCLTSAPTPQLRLLLLFTNLLTRYISFKRYARVIQSHCLFWKKASSWVRNM